MWCKLQQMMSVLKDALTHLLEQPLGAIVVCLLYWVWKQDSRISSSQEKRVQDAYRLAEIATKCASALERNTDVLDALSKT